MQKLNKERIREYYKTAKLYLKPHSTWRLYKIEVEPDVWKTIPNQIRNEEHLRKILVQEAPLNVFSSCSLWLNPLKIERPSYVKADRLFLGNLVFIDIDGHDDKNFIKVQEFFDSRPRYKLWKRVDSGNGYHVYYKDLKKAEIADPIKRYKEKAKERKALALEIKGEGIIIDEKHCLLDMERVSRVIGTLNDGEVPCHEIDGPLGLRTGLERRKPMNGITTQHNIGMVREPGPPSIPFYFPFIDSQIEGIKDKHAVILKFNKRRKYWKIKKWLKRAQETYNLSDFYVFDTKKEYVCLCLKGVSKRRYIKILRYTRASNVFPLVKYGHIWFRTGSIHNGKFIYEKVPKLIEVMEGLKGMTHFHSKPHLNYLKSYKQKHPETEFDIIDYTNLFGKEKNKIRPAKCKIPITILEEKIKKGEL